jgi:2-dehydropantoate 2-reductase
MRIAIFGTGGAGGYFGARLAQAGEDVVFVARGAHLDAIRKHGLRVESIRGDVHIRPARATDRPDEIGPVDWVVCGVKAWQVSAAAQAMRPLMGARSAVLPLQNGVEAADQLAAVLGREHVVGGAAWIASHVAAPGIIRHIGVEPRVVLGELDGRASARAEALRDAFVRAGERAELSADIGAVVWAKFVFIAAVSGVGAVTRVPVGESRALAETRRLLAAAIEETAALARAHGVALAPDVAAATLAFIDQLTPHTTASMQRDIADGRPSELEAQNGAAVRLGRALGVPTPTHEFLYAALLPLERRARLDGAGPRRT